MSKYEPSEEELGFNPYINDQTTYHKLNHSHYAVENVDHRRRVNKWKTQEKERDKLAKHLGVLYSPVLTPTEDILGKKSK